MTRTPVRILLIGGGHAHVEVLRRIRGLGPDPAVTLVSPSAVSLYSGMLPGHVAGHIPIDDMAIDVSALAASAGARFVEAAAVGFDRAARTVDLSTGERLAYDLVSLDIGSAPAVAALPGAADHAIPVKPIDGFLRRIDGLERRRRADGPPVRVIVVGGGAGGSEIAMAIRARLGGPARAAVTVLAPGGLVPSLNARARRRLAAAFERRAIGVVAARAVAVEPDAVITDDGRRIEADAVLLATGSRAPSVLAGLGLPLAAAGDLPVGPTLQALGDDTVFAAGDCAHLGWDPRPKAGVFPVRQGPVLAANLLAAARGDRLQRFDPQPAFLVIMDTAEGSAIAARGQSLAVEGKAVLAWKRWLDRRFMRRYRQPS